MMGLRSVVLVSLWVATGVVPVAGQDDFADIELELVLSSGLSAPVALTHANDDRLFVTEKVGRVRVVRNGSLLAVPFLDISALVRSGGEQGLLSVAFHPQYPQTPWLFVNYTDTNGDTVIARYSVGANPDRADPGSGVTLLTVGQPFGNHNGGQLQFGPDGMLWIATGDGGSGDDPQCNAQRAGLLGKMLRLDVDTNSASPPFHGIPADNPFVGNGEQPDEVWATGLRNPWRFSFDRQSGDLWIADVGQNQREEVNRVGFGTAGGQNFGWKMMEGGRCRNQSAGCPGPIPPCGSPAYTAPVLEYNHSSGCAVTGGYVYRGNDAPALVGRYIYGDYCSGTIWAGEQLAGTSSYTSRLLPIAVTQLSSFGEDSSGELYVVSESGRIDRIVQTTGASTGRLALVERQVTVSESAGSVLVVATRSEGTEGAVSAEVRSVAGSANPGVDYAADAVTLFWADGEAGAKTAEITILDDAIEEPDETFEVLLAAGEGGVNLDATPLTVTIRDDDLVLGECTTAGDTACLQDERFRVRATWRTRDGDSGAASAERLTADTGWFWFFSNDNVELVIKVLDACRQFDRFWVFAAGLTDVQVDIQVVDMLTGEIRAYQNQLGVPFQPILDTSAFSTCE